MRVGGNRLGIEMNPFRRFAGVLHSEDVPLPDIAGAVGTPVYVYSSNWVASQYRRVAEGLAGLNCLICFALKANSNQAILKLLADLGAGFDAVSGGEIERVLAIGAPGSRIVFSGVGKTRQEMRNALQAGVRHFNVESEQELVQLNEVAISMDAVAPVALRVNPDVDAMTHKKISTGKSENKFGIPAQRTRDVCFMAEALKGIRIVGIDIHIGSQLTSLVPLEAAYRKAAELASALRSEGIPIDRIDLGGGLGVGYGGGEPDPPQIGDWCELIRRSVGSAGCEIEIEPGRLLVAEAGVLLTSALCLKDGLDRRFLVVDAAMNDLLRPAMYDAYHEILNVRSRAGAKRRIVDIVGPVCESSDTFAVQRELEEAMEGDLLAIMTAGAYGAVMASEYNARPLVPEVLVNGNGFDIIRKRGSVAEMISRDIIPDWLQPEPMRQANS